MDLKEIESLLDDAMEMRVPRETDRGRERIEALESYLLDVVYMNAELVEARHHLREATSALEAEWARLEGWEMHMGNKPRARWTKPEMQAAKLKANRPLYEAGRKAGRLRQSVDDQIERFEREERNISRLYTMISGS